MSTTDRLRRARSLTWTEHAAVVEAVVVLGAPRVAVPHLPFRLLARLVGLTPGDAEASDAAGRAAEVGLAVRRSAAYLPFETTCLMQALAGAAMLHRRHMRAVLQFGVANDDSMIDKLIAHAWLLAGARSSRGGRRCQSVRTRFCDHTAPPRPRLRVR